MTEQSTYYRPSKLDYLYDAATSIDDEVKLALPFHVYTLSPMHTSMSNTLTLITPHHFQFVCEQAEVLFLFLRY